MKNSRVRQDLLISINDSDFAILRGFYFHETSHMRCFAKINPSRKFPNLHYVADTVVNVYLLKLLRIHRIIKNYQPAISESVARANHKTHQITTHQACAIREGLDGVW